VDDRTRASLLWGAVAALAFLVLAQGYNLLGAGGITAVVLFGVAVAVAVVATLATYVAEGALRRESERD
jgi:ABC-type nickel/cobalt efflux system permease component RcnA